MGVSVFSPNVQWVESTEDLFVEVRPQFPGRELVIPPFLTEHKSRAYAAFEGLSKTGVFITGNFRPQGAGHDIRPALNLPAMSA